MRSLKVVSVNPMSDAESSSSGGLIGSSVNTLSKHRLDESLGFAVGLWRVGPGEDVLHLGLATGGSEEF
jgi:hypothetical protein